MARIDYSDCSGRCFRTDHNQGRLVNSRRQQAHEKHGDNSIEAIPADSPQFLSILIEEIGELAHAMTYDSGETSVDLANELLDVMSVCGAWLDALRVEGINPDSRGAWLA